MKQSPQAFANELKSKRGLIPALSLALSMKNLSDDLKGRSVTELTPFSDEVELIPSFYKDKEGKERMQIVMRVEYQKVLSRSKKTAEFWKNVYFHLNKIQKNMKAQQEAEMSLM